MSDANKLKRKPLRINKPYVNREQVDVRELVRRWKTIAHESASVGLQIAIDDLIKEAKAKGWRYE